eukprot:CAMPEP_0173378442 /NCGR_PEP_ID=MMETSP1356-20130122/1604_1 /TAXON_ID=77927 ORGANISM="Hemiselmis virescens, Strain PCC157" /NCGR_SAMPLE_ID=MMETSP1356 /ASSEMBLY_ACC=CAM_ASM_000847 /LENGTH=77 /DNA_ID=CAMNT_0014331507 /DNA_START=101 /DNA_END=334 /DNA_ORIENTATION=-
MFELLKATAAQVLDDKPKEFTIKHPPSDYIAPQGASRNTWRNIYKNKENIKYCTQQFHYLSNRIHCITDMTGGPFLS